MKRAAIYLRVSTQDQTTANQEHELRQAAERAGWQVAKVDKDHGIRGAKGRNARPAFDALCRDATKRQFDVVMAWNVDRLGRSLKEPVAFLSELHALGIDLFLHQQGLEGPRREARPCFRCSDQRARRAVELGDEVAGKALHHRCDKLRADAVPSLLSP